MAKRNLMPGSLDLMVLQTVLTGGPQHGYGIARFIEKTSGDELQLNQGTIHASLIRLNRRGWIRSQWGTSENNRKAKFYELTKARVQAAVCGYSRMGVVFKPDGPRIGIGQGILLMLSSGMNPVRFHLGVLLFALAQERGDTAIATRNGRLTVRAQLLYRKRCESTVRQVSLSWNSLSYSVVPFSMAP